MTRLERSTSKFKVEAHLNGKPACPVIVWGLENSEQIALDEVNLCSEKDRSRLLSASSIMALPVESRRDLGELLNLVGIEAARSREARKAEQGRISSLTALDPWEIPVEGGALLEGLARALSQHVYLPEGASLAIALWILHAYAHEAAQVSPILAICSPEKRCGKTTLLLVLGQLTPKPLPTSNVTPAVLFRAIEQYHPTLLIDEADTFLPSRPDGGELRGILNSGHTKASAFVLRCVGDAHEPRAFSTWCPRAVACIGGLPETLEDRSIRVQMRRRAPHERVERLRQDQPEKFRDLCRQCVRWVADNVQTLQLADPQVPSGLDDRAADNWRPLLAIADRIGGPWPQAARHAASLIMGIREESTSVSELLLSDIKEAFESFGADRLSTMEILENLVAREERPWGEWGSSGTPINARGLSAQLRKFGIRSGTYRRGPDVFKGYLRSDFKDAWARYLRLHT
jgi:putative DNA primase/helicase